MDMDRPFFKHRTLLTGHTTRYHNIIGMGTCTEIDHNKDVLCPKNGIAMHPNLLLKFLP